MEKRKSGVDRLSLLAAAVVLIGLLVWGGYSLVSTLLTPDDASNTAEPLNKEVSRSSFNEPKTISLDEVANMTGADFVNKYKGEWVSFDGLVIGTSQNKNNSGPVAGIVLGDNANELSFSDGSMFRIGASKFAFDESLQKYAEVSSTSSVSQKVHVIAKVGIYDADTLAVMLERNSNLDGEKPSIVAR